MRLLWLLPLILLLGCSSEDRQRERIVVSAAASLTDGITDCAREFERAHPGVTVELNFAGSGVLQKQIEQGAPVDVFISASPKEMDALEEQELIQAESRRDVASNTLVLIGAVSDWEDLRRAKRIAISNPDTVPSGRYAKQVLSAKGLWDAVEPNLVYGENVRQTVTYVARGDADAGIVFSTDAAAEGLKPVATAVASEHDPILYPAAAASKVSLAQEFLDFLSSKGGQALMRKHGFGKGG